MKRSIVARAFLVSMLSFFPCMSQSDIYLQHRYKPNRQKRINLNHTYTVQTIDSTYYHSKLSIYSKDSLTLYSEGNDKATHIGFNEVSCLERKKKSYIVEAVAIVGIICLTISPIIWATEGNEAALEMLEASGALLAVSVPFWVLKEIGRKKDTKNKWMISTI